VPEDKLEEIRQELMIDLSPPASADVTDVSV
jgi:hypothetical protein